MVKQKERYRIWEESFAKAWVSGDMEAMMACWAEECSHTAVDPFGEHKTTTGREAIRALYAQKAASREDKKLIEHEVLSANKERGILHRWVSWTNEDGQEWACTHINIVQLDEHDRCTKYTEWNVAGPKEDEVTGLGS